MGFDPVLIHSSVFPSRVYVGWCLVKWMTSVQQPMAETSSFRGLSSINVISLSHITDIWNNWIEGKQDEPSHLFFPLLKVKLNLEMMNFPLQSLWGQKKKKKAKHSFSPISLKFNRTCADLCKKWPKFFKGR